MLAGGSLWATAACATCRVGRHPRLAFANPRHGPSLQALLDDEEGLGLEDEEEEEGEEEEDGDEQAGLRDGAL